ncbi:biotin protein ligase [Metarhizium robertsii ARSEF 23]|uniref:Biotin protein ligase n=1 Tax=Metarhizium robertsii (strain ARSEF 23 / ATCC MYA-3075) TaxID=655844 RepID=A0A0B2XIX1_METRA|nr:biotin protein ligase [Metarhizium robertsii ARSEF 23]KHO11791.1 biotin protein ligase [Metarhizium robertsii ARSEF 23]
MSNDDAAWIDSWRHSVPSRLEREDPFENDGFEARCSTRLTFREPDPPPRSANRGFFRSMTPFRRSTVQEAATDRPQAGHEVLEQDSLQRFDTRMSTRCDDKGKRNFLGLFSRKRKQRSPSPSRRLAMGGSLRLRVLCVGDRGCGQTALLYRAKFGRFVDTAAISRTPYETYILDKRYHCPATMEL